MKYILLAAIGFLSQAEPEYAQVCRYPVNQQMAYRQQKLQQQVEKISTHREHREAARRALVQSVGGTEDTTFKQMTAMMPEEYQPLLNALVEEINQLLQRIQTWMKQNHLLLKRSLDLMSKIMHSIFPTSSAAAQTYGQGGTVSPIAPPPSTLYEGMI
jgi:flagellar biosynthesis/type III secretory pathway chaperone